MDIIKKKCLSLIYRSMKSEVVRRRLQQWAAAIQFQSKEKNECAFRFVAFYKYLSDFINNYRISNFALYGIQKGNICMFRRHIGRTC